MAAGFPESGTVEPAGLASEVQTPHVGTDRVMKVAGKPVLVCTGGEYFGGRLQLLAQRRSPGHNLKPRAQLLI